MGTAVGGVVCELGPLQISANVLNPGPVGTGWMDAEIRQALTPRHPLGRLGEPSDIADVVALLVFPAGRWISGQFIQSDGGFSARF